MSSPTIAERQAAFEEPKITRVERQARKARRNVAKEQQATLRAVKLEAALQTLQGQREQRLLAKLQTETPQTQPKTKEAPSWIQRIAASKSRVLERLRQKPPQRPPKMQPAPSLQPSEA